MVLRALLELIETCLEGLRYIHFRLNENIMSSTIYLLEDVVDSFFSIHYHLNPFNEKLEKSEYIQDYIYTLEYMLSELISDYEHRHIDNALIRLENYIIPQFTKLYEETSRNYIPFIIS